MAEVLGLIASVITIAQALDVTLKLARPFFRAEKELEELQHDIADFTSFIAELQAQQLGSSNDRLAVILHRSQQTIDQLNRLIKNDLLRCKNGVPNRARRKSWLRHKSKVLTLQARLRSSRDDILAAVNVINVTSNLRSETLLSGLSRTATEIEDIALDLGKRMKAMHRDLDSTVSLHASVVLGHISHMQAPTHTKFITMEPISPYRGFLVEASDAQNRISTEVVNEGSIQPTADQTSGPADPHFPISLCVQPATSLELSHNFMPEIYTSASMIPKMVVTSYYQQSASSLSKVSCYRVLFFQSSRRWFHMNILLEIPRSSIYWSATDFSQQEYYVEHKFFASTSIPASLLKKLQHCVEGLGTIEENARPRFVLSTDDTAILDRMEPPPLIPLHLTYASPYNTPKLTERAIIAYLEDLNIPRYSEEHVTQVALLESPNRYIACLQGTLVEEVKSSLHPPRPDFLYEIQLLHCLRDVPGIVGLVAVIVNLTKQLLKSYLIKLPTSKCELLLHRSSKHSVAKSWEEVEDWTRQIIHLLSEVHTRGYVLGTLWRERTPFLVDASGALHLYRFQSRIEASLWASFWYPPEYRHYKTLYKTGATLDEAEHPLVTPKFDVLQLGQFLWFLAQSWASGESIQSLKERSMMDWDSVARAQLTEPVPAYYIDMVEACRADDPFDRPSAAKLLSCFPPGRSEHGSQVGKTASLETGEIMNVDAMWKCRPWSNFCSKCGDIVEGVIFHCNICDSGDFDACAKCFEAGAHCPDDSHLLIEVQSFSNCPVGTRRHSSMGSSGARIVTEV